MKKVLLFMTMFLLSSCGKESIPVYQSGMGEVEYQKELVLWLNDKFDDLTEKNIENYKNDVRKIKSQITKELNDKSQDELVVFIDDLAKKLFDSSKKNIKISSNEWEFLFTPYVSEDASSSSLEMVKYIINDVIYTNFGEFSPDFSKKMRKELSEQNYHYVLNNTTLPKVIKDESFIKYYDIKQSLKNDIKNKINSANVSFDIDVNVYLKLIADRSEKVKSLKDIWGNFLSVEQIKSKLSHLKSLSIDNIIDSRDLDTIFETLISNAYDQKGRLRTAQKDLEGIQKRIKEAQASGDYYGTLADYQERLKEEQKRVNKEKQDFNEIKTVIESHKKEIIDKSEKLLSEINLLLEKEKSITINLKKWVDIIKTVQTQLQQDNMIVPSPFNKRNLFGLYDKMNSFYIFKDDKNLGKIFDIEHMKEFVDYFQEYIN